MKAEIAHLSEEFFHLKFTDGTLASDKIDHLSKASVGKLMDVAKDDHRKFVQRIEDAVNGKITVQPAELSTHHTCRLGRWYDSVTDDRIMGLPAFKGLMGRHRPVHAVARDILVALGEGKQSEAKQMLVQLHKLSNDVIVGLSDLQTEFMDLRDAA